MADRISMHRSIIMLLAAMSLALAACGPKVKNPSGAGSETAVGGSGAQGSGAGSSGAGGSSSND